MACIISFISDLHIFTCRFNFSLSLSHTHAHTLMYTYTHNSHTHTQASKASDAHKDPLSRKSASYASSKEVCKFIMELGISKVHVHTDTSM